MVRKVETCEEFNGFIEQETLTIVDFYADWCGPCRAIAPFYTDLSVKYPDVNFIKVNVDDSDLAPIINGAYISSIPDFIFYKNGVKVGGMKGANGKKLEELVVKLQ